MRYTLPILLILALPAAADTLYLKNGGKLEGKVLARRDGKVHFQMRHGKTVFAESEVARIVAGRTPAEVYLERKGRLAFTDAAGHWALAGWCKRNKLAEQYRAQLAQVVKIDPDHAAARKALGQVKVGKRWLPEKEAMKALGYQFHQGQWYRPDQLRELYKKQALDQRTARTQRRVNQLVLQMALKSDERRKQAHGALVALAREEGIPQLVEVAGKLYQQYQKFWSTHRHVTIEVRATNAALQGIDLIPTSIASGGGSTGTIFIEAPRISMSKANTTVVVPAGGGR